ncbi:phospholipase D delta-like isoform X2 [Tasmannia lanceolata]|uniref:phospholipase D delta-like isoform X2 n=1 Tax=Tasmannia lanceolata TaxID=3420 RepID=UPI0040633710
MEEIYWEGGSYGSVSEKVIFLHGDLNIWILEAKFLPNMDLLTERFRRCVTLSGCVRYPGRRNPHQPRRKIITSDPYVKVCLAGASVARTAVIPNSQNPVWNEHFDVPVAHPVSRVEFQVKDNDIFGAQLIGIVGISAHRILSGELIEDWFPVIASTGNPPKPGSALHLKLQFRPFENSPWYRRSIAADPDHLGVRGTYFPVRRGGLVTLYQDAHNPDGLLPEIQLENGKTYLHGKCWEDICHAILEAHHLIYIVGWSIYDKVKLVRESTRPLPPGGELTLGDLLKYKSQEGVRVCLLVWDDKTSHNKLFINTGGVMQTHDEETRKFFKHSSVICVLSPRYGSSKLSIFKQQTKTSGPRQPWHDLHCKIEGPAAYDILQNFEQRWRKATKWWEFGARFKKVSHWNDDALIKLERISWILSPTPSIPNDDPSLWVSEEKDPENWHVQVFRSIDSGSVKGFPKTVYEADKQNLACGKNLVTDRSIHTAYVKAIRSAQHFIYIENQYFLGSSYGWPSYNNAGADNLIPMELALKIASKIRAKERFAVYIVIPMWPEGVPSSAPIQEILFWQGQTMRMMYDIVGKELNSSGFVNSHPQDYLNFYCLGNREEPPKEKIQSTNQPSQNCDSFMIYVHAKGMIVDDEYVILGSANINQRSLDGSRDTEIAMGAYQPHHTWDRKKRHPLGQVYGYRMSLWAEHLGRLDDLFKEPHSLNCVEEVNKIAEDNWKRYTAEEPTKLCGHLLRYPIKVGADGKVGPLDGHENFPNVGGKVLGAHSSLPDVLTM